MNPEAHHKTIDKRLETAEVKKQSLIHSHTLNTFPPHPPPLLIPPQLPPPLIIIIYNLDLLLDLI